MCFVQDWWSYLWLAHGYVNVTGAVASFHDVGVHLHGRQHPASGWQLQLPRHRAHSGDSLPNHNEGEGGGGFLTLLLQHQFTVIFLSSSCLSWGPSCLSSLQQQMYMIHPVTRNKYSICREAEAVMLKSKFINAVFYDIYVCWNLPTYLGIVSCIIYNPSIRTYTHLFTHLSYTFTFINFSSIHFTHPGHPSVSFHSLLQGVGFWVCCLCVWPAHSCASFLNKITCIEAGVWFWHHLCTGVSKGRGPQWGGHGDHGASGLCRRLPTHPWAPKADDLHHAAACGRNWALHVAPPAGLHRGCGSANKDQHRWANNRKGKGMWVAGPWVLFCFFLCFSCFGGWGE